MSAPETTRDWDGATYDRVSTPQEEMARGVLDRMPLGGDETVLDAGCGSGRVTRLLLERLPRGRVIAVDAAPSMVEQARAALPADRADVRLGSLTELDLDAEVDAVFSNAVFHWIPDHPLLWRRLHTALRPGGRLVAQCGGEGNIERFHAIAREVAEHDPWREHLGGWEGPWNFASAELTATELQAAGFKEIETWLEPWPVRPDEPRAYISTVCLGPHLQALPESLREGFVDAVTACYPEGMELDYVRLNIDARRPARR